MFSGKTQPCPNLCPECLRQWAGLTWYLLVIYRCYWRQLVLAERRLLGQTWHTNASCINTICLVLLCVQWTGLLLVPFWHAFGSMYSKSFLGSVNRTIWLHQPIPSDIHAFAWKQTFVTLYEVWCRLCSSESTTDDLIATIKEKSGTFYWEKNVACYIFGAALSCLVSYQSVIHLCAHVTPLPFYWSTLFL